MIWDRAKAFNVGRIEEDPDYKCHMALERGGQETHLHVQGVMDILTTSSIKVNADIKKAMKGTGNTVPANLIGEFMFIVIQVWAIRLTRCLFNSQCEAAERNWFAHVARNAGLLPERPVQGTLRVPPG